MTILAARKLSSVGANREGVADVAERVDTDGSRIVKLLSAKNAGFVEEGSLFLAATPTAGTGVKLSVDAATAITATAPSILIYNNDQAGGKNIILDTIKLISSTAGAGLSTLNMAMFIDNATRYTSGGNAVTPVQPNMSMGNTSIAKFFDASTAIVSPAATTAVRKVGRIYARTAIPVVGDTHVIEFGGTAGGSNGVTNGTAALSLTWPMPAVVLGPQQSFLLYIWAASMSTAPAFEYDVTWIER